MKTVSTIKEEVFRYRQYTPEDWKKEPTGNMRAIARRLGIQGIERDGKVIKVDCARKGEILKDILAVIEIYQVSQDIDLGLLDKDLELIKEATEDCGLVEFTKSVFERFDKITKQQLDGRVNDNLGMRALALDISSALMRRYPEPSTFVVNRAHLFTNLKKLIEKQYVAGIDLQFSMRNHKYFRELVLENTKEFSLEVKKHNNKTWLEKKGKVTEINPNKALDFAFEVLKNPSASVWYNTAIALELVTGRRMFSELLCTAEFEVIGDYEIAFSGHAKLREGGEVAYNIPTLIPANLCKQGLDYLKSKGKRVNVEDFGGDEQLARVKSKNRWSKEVNGHLKKVWSPLIEVVDDKGTNAVSSHKLRNIYGRCAKDAFCPKGFTDNDYLGSILGHDPSDRGAATTERYIKGFSLAPETIPTR